MTRKMHLTSRFRRGSDPALKIKGGQPSGPRRTRGGMSAFVARALVCVLTPLVMSSQGGFAQQAEPAQPTQEPQAGQAAQTLPVHSQILSVDRERLFTQSLYGRRILAELEVERARLAAEARKVDAALVAEEKNLTEQRDKLSSDAFRLLADAFDEKVQALRRERPAREKDFTDRFEREQLAFYEKIGPALGAVVRERGGVVILDRRAILLATQNIDITDAALARIDQVIGDGATDPVPSPAQDDPAAN